MGALSCTSWPPRHGGQLSRCPVLGCAAVRTLAATVVLTVAACTPSPSPPPAASTASTVKSAPPDGASSKPRGPETPEQRAARLHKDAIIVDGHNDIPSVMLGSGFEL